MEKEEEEEKGVQHGALSGKEQGEERLGSGGYFTWDEREGQGVGRVRRSS